MTDHVPPHDLEAELAVLGAMLLVTDPADAKAITDVVAPSDFYRGPHGQVFAAQIDLWETKFACDALLLRNDLQETGHLAAVGGTAFVGRIAASVPSSANAVHYARIVRKRRLERDVLEASRLHEEAQRDGGNGLATQAFARLTTARTSLEDFEHERTLRVCAVDLVDAVEGPEPPEPEMFVDRLFIRPSLNIIFGAPASGKSWSAMSLGIDAATTGGYFLGSSDLRIHLSANGTPEALLWIYGGEDTEARVIRRMKKLYGRGDPNYPLHRGRVLFQTPPEGIMLNTPAGWRWLDKMLDTYKPTLLCLDTVASLCGHTLEVRDEAHVVPFMQKLLAIRKSRTCTIFLLHHTSKPAKDAGRSTASKASSMLGSQAWLSLAESVLMLDAEDGKTEDVTIRCVKTKDVPDPIPPFRISLDRDTGRFFMLDEEAAAPERKAVSKGGRPLKFSVDAILALRPQFPDGIPWNHTTIGPLLDVGKSQWFDRLDNVWTGLMDKGCVVVQGTLRWPS